MRKLSKRLSKYSNNEYSHTHNTSMAGKLIRAQAEQIMGLKERDTEKAPEIHKNKRSSVYTCPSCNLVLINKDEKGWFCGEHYKFCPDCGQRIKWEN